MWKHKNFINLQLHAIGDITVNFDSNITKVQCIAKDWEWTTSGSALEVSGVQDGTAYLFNVTLATGYVLDTVSADFNSDGSSISAQSDTSFTIVAGSGASWTITLTSKSVAFDGKVNITKSAGVVLKTQGKYCDQDITVVPVLEEKSVTPTESAQEVTPSTGNCGLSKVSVGAVQTETKSVTPTTSAQTVTPTSGKYLKQVIVGAIQIETKNATPSASAQTITPTSGKYLASVTVSAVPSESKTVTPTKSVQSVTPSSGKWLSSVTVNAIPDNYIIPSGSQDITENGTYDVTSKASVSVSVPITPIEDVATSSAMDALLVEANVGKLYKFTGTTDSNYTNGDLYLVESGGQ